MYLLRTAAGGEQPPPSCGVLTCAVGERDSIAYSLDRGGYKKIGVAGASLHALGYRRNRQSSLFITVSVITDCIPLRCG